LDENQNMMPRYIISMVFSRYGLPEERVDSNHRRIGPSRTWQESDSLHLI
jgi:hypothetical protein